MPHPQQRSVSLRLGMATNDPFVPSMIFRSRTTKALSNVTEQNACSRSLFSATSLMRTSVMTTADLLFPVAVLDIVAVAQMSSNPKFAPPATRPPSCLTSGRTAAAIRRASAASRARANTVDPLPLTSAAIGRLGRESTQPLVQLRPQGQRRFLQPVVQRPADRFHVAGSHGFLQLRSALRGGRHTSRADTRRRCSARTAGKPAPGSASCPTATGSPLLRGRYTTRPASRRKNATSLPSSAANRTNSPVVRPSFHSRFNPTSVAAASDEPPPSPAWIGIRFVNVDRCTGGRAGLPAEQLGRSHHQVLRSRSERRVGAREAKPSRPGRTPERRTS